MATEHEIINKLDSVCKNILNNSKNEIYMHLRFLVMAFEGLKPAMSNETQTLGTDGFYLHYSPLFLMHTFEENKMWIDRAYVHMIFHCIFKHPVSLEQRDERIFNVSADIATEFVIDSLNKRILKRKTTGFRQMVYETIKENIKVPTAQSIYNYILENEKFLGMIEDLEKEFLVDDHCFWVDYKDVPMPQNNDNSEDNDNDDDNTPNNDNSPEENEKKNDFNEKWRQISQKTETDAETISKDYSEGSENLIEYLRLENRERYDYKEFLRKFMVRREIMQLDLDSYDYIYYTYGLNVYGNMPLIENLEYSDVKKVEEFVIVIDTSASCESDLVKKFLEESYGILKDEESFFRKINLHIIQCDTKIQSDEIITCKEDFEKYMSHFEIKGRGGTDFTAAFDYVNELVDKKVLEDLKGLIYFTDGYGIYPNKKPVYETAFIFIDDNFDNRGVPNWAIEIIIGKDDIKFN